MIGFAAGLFNKNSNIVAVGDSALYFNSNGASGVQGTNNTAVGSKAAYSNSTGYNITAFGRQALYSNTSGGYNTAVGTNALWANTTAGYNTAVGNNTMPLNTTGQFNTALGNAALYNNSTGNYNTATGNEAMNKNTTGLQNTANGAFALSNNTTGDANTGIGTNSLLNNSSGIGNTGIGRRSGETNQSGSNNTFIGYLSNAGSSALTYATAVGAQATVNCNNCLTLGGSTPATRTSVGININAPTFSLDINQFSTSYGSGIGLRYLGNNWEMLQASTTNFWFNYNGWLTAWINSGTGAYTAVSDKRLKDNIQPLEPVLAKVMRLSAARYEYNRNNPEKNQSIGFIAQDVIKVFPEVVSKQPIKKGSSGIDEIYGIDYANLSVVAIKAIQEQQSIINSQKSNIESLEAKNRLLEERLLRIERKLGIQ